MSNYPHKTTNSIGQVIRNEYSDGGIREYSYYPSGRLMEELSNGIVSIYKHHDVDPNIVSYYKTKAGRECWFDEVGYAIPDPSIPKSGDKYEIDGNIYTLQKLPDFDAWMLVRIHPHDKDIILHWTGPKDTPEHAGINHENMRRVIA